MKESKENNPGLSSPVFVELLGAVLDKGAPMQFAAKGLSMSPFIKDGDVITVFPLAGASPRLGDVVAFIHPDKKKLIVHRIVGKRNASYIIKGDSSSVVDNFIPQVNILGRVGKIEREGKKVFLGLGPERFLIAFFTRRELLAPLLSPAWRFLRHFRREDRK